jgi:hypothetical protein
MTFQELKKTARRAVLTSYFKQLPVLMVSKIF